MTLVRDDNETTSSGWGRCPVCDANYRRVRRQIYCSPACKQIAWRARTQPNPAPAIPPEHRREHTIYQCGECETRYLGEQWCPDCTRPCRSLGPGGLCGHCSEPLTFQELLTGEVLT